jgi:hypothetical protein
MATSHPVQYRRLGKSGLRVSVPILGGASLGSSKWMPWVLDEAEVCSQAISYYLVTECNTGTPHTQGRLGKGRYNLGHSQ